VELLALGSEAEAGLTLDQQAFLQAAREWLKRASLVDFEPSASHEPRPKRVPEPRLQHPVRYRSAERMTMNSIHGRADLRARPPVGRERPIHRVFDDYLRTRVPDATTEEIAVHDNLVAPEETLMVRDE
jgi:hypothetical protein